MIVAGLIILILTNAIAISYLALIANELRAVREITRVQAQKLDVFLEAINDHILDIHAEIKKK